MSDYLAVQVGQVLERTGHVSIVFQDRLNFSHCKALFVGEIIDIHLQISHFVNTGRILVYYYLFFLPIFINTEVVVILHILGYYNNCM